MVIKKKNPLSINVKTDFLSPRTTNLKRVKTTTFGLGPIKKINFMPAKTKKGSVHKQISMSLVPTKKVKFVSPEQFLTPYPKKGGKKISKKNMNWFQAKQKFPKLNPFGDADKDKVINMFDCRPFDPTQDGGIISSAKAAASKVASTAGKVVTAAKETYKKVDVKVGGILPGGAEAKTPAAKTVEKALTGAAKAAAIITAAPAVVATKAGAAVVKTISGGGRGGGGGITGGTIGGGGPNEPTITKEEPQKITLFGGGTADGKSEGGIGLTGSTTTQTKPGGTIFGKVAGKVGQAVYNAADIVTLGILPGGVFKPAWDIGNLYSYADTKLAGGELPGGAPKPPMTSFVTKLSQEQVPEEEIKKQRHVDIFMPLPPEPDDTKPEPEIRYIERVEYVTPTTTEAALTSEQIKSLFSEASTYHRGGVRWRPQNITATAEITPQQLPLIDVQNLIRGKYPMILNINPNERIRIPAYILAMRPTIIYTTELPTRLAFYSPKTGTTGTEYTEYNLRIAELPQ